MESTNVVLRKAPYGEVQLFSDGIKAGRMTMAISDDQLTVYHTEVKPEFNGHGFAKLLLDELVNYAKEHHLKIIPLCPYVHTQFRRYPEKYKEIWQN